MKPSQRRWSLFRRRECLVPTWQGWVVVLLVGAGLVVFGARRVHSFLAVNDPVPGGVLVVEGWLPDYALEQVIAEFRRDHYTKVFVTGVPLEQGAYLSQYHSLAELGAASLVRLGLDSNVVQAVPSLRVVRDRTYTSAVALKNWLPDHGIAETNVNVVSMGAHARRSRLLFSRALGTNYKVGVTCIRNRSYDPQRWWASSQGVETVVMATVGYCYARLLFRPATSAEE